MTWLLACQFIFASLSQEALEFLEGLSSECHKCRQPEVVSQENQNLLAFMSFSLPIESWKEWSYSIEKRGGVLVLRGLPGNSFRLFSEKVAALKEAGVLAPIRIDPEAFEKYKIDVVPSVVLINGDRYDKAAGNLHLDSILGKFLD